MNEVLLLSHVVFGARFLSLTITFTMFIHVVGCINMIPSYAQTIFRCMDISHFVRLSVGHSGCFRVLVVINIAAISIRVKVFVQTDILIYLGYIHPGRELPDHMITLCLNIGETVCLPKWLYHFIFLPVVHEGSDFFTFSPDLLLYDFWILVILVDMKRSHCGFDLHFLHG